MYNLKTNRDRIKNWQTYDQNETLYQNGEFYHEMINLINIRKKTEDLKNKVQRLNKYLQNNVKGDIHLFQVHVEYFQMLKYAVP